MLFQTFSRVLTLVYMVFCLSCSQKNPDNVPMVPSVAPCRLPNMVTSPAVVPSITPNQLPDTEAIDVAIGFPLNMDRQKTTGTVKVAVIFVDFSDAPATRTSQQVLDLVSPASENFLSTTSQGKLKVVFEPKLKWYRMSKPSTDYGWSDPSASDLYKGYIQEAVNLASSEVNFSQSDQLLIISNPDGGALTNGPTFTGTATNGIVAGSKIFANAITSGRDLLGYTGRWFPHEFGHSMGLPDLYTYSGMLQHGFVGDFSAMGNLSGTAPEYTAWEKWLLGWFTDDQVQCVNVPKTGSIQLTPLEVTGGMKLLVLTIDATTAVIVEDRRAIGNDRQIPKEGPVVYLINTKLASGNGPLKVLPIDEADQIKTQSALSVGQQLTYGTITVKCTASGSGGSTIEYERR